MYFCFLLPTSSSMNPLPPHDLLLPSQPRFLTPYYPVPLLTYAPTQTHPLSSSPRPHPFRRSHLNPRARSHPPPNRDYHPLGLLRSPPFEKPLNKTESIDVLPANNQETTDRLAQLRRAIDVARSGIRRASARNSPIVVDVLPLETNNNTLAPRPA